MLLRLLLGQFLRLNAKLEWEVLVLVRFIDGASFAILHNEVDPLILLILDDLNQADDVGMRDLLKYGDFLPDDLVCLVVGIPAEHLLLQLVLLQNLHGVGLARQSVLAYFDLCECSPANQLLYQVLVDLHFAVL